MGCENDVIHSINKLEKLYKIEFYMCEFKTKRTLNKNIIDITIYCCKEFSKEILDKSTNIEKLELTNSGLVDMNDLQIFKDLKLIKIRDCSLISLPKISSLDKLEYIYLNNLDIDNKNAHFHSYLSNLLNQYDNYHTLKLHFHNHDI